MKAFKFIFSLVTTVLLSSLFGAAVSQASGWDPASTILAVNGISIMVSAIGGVPVGALGASTVTVSDIVSQYGAYYMNKGDTQAQILQAFRAKRSIAQYATPILHDGDVYELSNATITNVLQPFHKTWSSKGNATFTAAPITLRRIKIDQDLTPDDFEGNWLGFLAGLGEADRSKWPAVRFIWEKLVADKAQEDHEECDWDGVYSAAPGGGTAGSHTALYNGIKKLVIDGFSDGMTEISLTNDPRDAAKAFDVIEEVAASLPRHWRNREVQFLVSPEMELNYFRDRRNTHGSDTNYRGESTMMTVDGRPNWTIVAMDGMGIAGDTADIVVTPKANLLHVTKRNSYSMGMTVDGRAVKAFADWREGIGFGVNELVYAYLNSEASGSF